MRVVTHNVVLSPNGSNPLRANREPVRTAPGLQLLANDPA